MNLKRSIALLMVVIMVGSSSNVSFAAITQEAETTKEGTFGTAEIDLSGKSDETVRKVLRENGIEYYAERDYEKLVICEQIGVAGNQKYKGQKYRIVYQYYNMPIKEVKKKNFKHWSTVNKAFNIAIGFAKPYVWIPATVLGVDFSKLEEPGPKSYVMTTVYTHMTEKCFQFVTKGHKSNDWANYGICRKASIEDTTIAYRLINKKKDKYTSIVGKKTTIRKTTHYDDNLYMLKKSYEYWQVSQPGYQEYIK